jgi:hypothetical protein
VISAGEIGTSLGAAGMCISAQMRRLRFPANQAGDTFLVPMRLSAN